MDLRIVRKFAVAADQAISTGDTVQCWHTTTNNNKKKKKNDDDSGSNNVSIIMIIGAPAGGQPAGVPPKQRRSGCISFCLISRNLVLQNC